MAPHHGVGPGLPPTLGQPPLVGGGAMLLLNSPVDHHHHQIGPPGGFGHRLHGELGGALVGRGHPARPGPAAQATWGNTRENPSTATVRPAASNSTGE